MPHLFDLLYSSWGSHGKYTGVVCHSLHQWITFCQNSDMTRLSWVALHSMAHSFIELHKLLHYDKAVIHEGEEGIRGWDGWMASPMQWTWTWANFWRWWRTGRPGVLPSMGLQRVRYDWVTEQYWMSHGLLRWFSGKESTCQCRRCKFNSW